MRGKQFERYFDIVYLLYAIGCGIYLLYNSNTMAAVLAGSMTLVLAAGDACHLVPRIADSYEHTGSYHKALGRGKQMTSITMTIFYILLWQVALELFPISSGYSIVLYICSILRILLCLMPQNQWTSKTPSVKWGIIRNVPFVVVGALTALVYYQNRTILGAMSWIWLAVVISFLCYIPVVLWAHRHRMLGMLMMPKTIAYMWIVLQCLSLAS